MTCVTRTCSPTALTSDNSSVFPWPEQVQPGKIRASSIHLRSSFLLYQLDYTLSTEYAATLLVSRVYGEKSFDNTRYVDRCRCRYRLTNHAKQRLEISDLANPLRVTFASFVAMCRHILASDMYTYIPVCIIFCLPCFLLSRVQGTRRNEKLTIRYIRNRANVLVATV